MNWLTKAIEAGGESRATLAEVEAGLFTDLGDRRAKSSQFWVLLALSSLIAAGGVAGNSTPAVIGAMIVAPLATPIYGIALATVIGSPKRLRTALLLLLGGIVLNVALGVVVGLITALRMPLESNPQIIGRTSPSLLDLGVAVVTGLAGSFALARRDVSNILAGVAIAISLVPVLAVVGITLGAGRFDLAWGAMVLFLTNVAAILVAGVLVFGAAGFVGEAADRDARVAVHARIFIAVFVVLVIVPLSLQSLQAWRYDHWVGATTSASRAWLSGTAWRVESVEVDGKDIVVTAIGPGNPPSIDALRTAVRRSVPGNVPVEVVAENGTTAHL